MEEEKTLEESIAGLYFSYACRALLGGGKGQSVMIQLYDREPESYRLVMEAARKHLANDPHLSQEPIEKRYRQLQVVVGDLERERSN